MTAFRALSPTMRGSLLIVVGAIFAGIIGPLAAILYDQGMTPFSFVVWRGIVAGGALWLLVLWRRRRDPGTYRLVYRRLPRREKLALAGFVASNIVLNTSLFVAFDLIPIAIALLTFYTYPVLLALYGRISGTESLGPVKIASLGLALAGLLLVVTANFDPHGRGPGPTRPGARFRVGVRRGGVDRLRSSLPVGPARAGDGAGIDDDRALRSGSWPFSPGPVAALQFPFDHPDVWPTILVSGIISGAGAAFLFTMGIRLIGRVRAGILGLIEPIVGTVAAAVVLGQVLTPVQLLGGALVLGAAVLIQRDSEEAAAAAGDSGGAGRPRADDSLDLPQVRAAARTRPGMPPPRRLPRRSLPRSGSR